MHAAEIDALWDYADPAGSELRFRGLAGSASGDALAEIETQVARSLGLQRKFAEAHAALDAMVASPGSRAEARGWLERGRVFNSSGDPEGALPWFTRALDSFNIQGEEFYAIDAAHMLGIASAGDKALAWNLEAIAMARRAADERAKGWLGSLLNNTGWALHDLGRFEEALQLFEQALEFRLGKGAPGPVRIAKYCVARCLRSLGRHIEALEQVRAVYDEDPGDGYLAEEIAENTLVVDGPTPAREWFARAHALLSDDPWLKQDEPQRLARLAELGGQPTT